MASDDSISKAVAVAVPKLVPILSPLSAEGRQRAVASAMMIFGEAAPAADSSTGTDKKTGQQESQMGGDGICHKAAVWMKKNAITREQLEMFSQSIKTPLI